MATPPPRQPWDPSPPKKTYANVRKAVRALMGSKARKRSLAQFERTRKLAASPPFEVKPVPRQWRPWLGLEDPRCEGYVVVEYGRLVRVVGRPC